MNRAYDHYILALALDPATPATSGEASGVFKRPGGSGRRWTWPEMCVRALVIDPATSGTLYAGHARGVYSNWTGEQWTAIEVV